MTKLEQWMRAQTPRVSDQALADMIGANRATINAIKQGTRVPSLAVAVKLMDVTGLRAVDFLGGEE